MAQTAPFHSAMRLGQGFNSYTQELRLDGAVKIVMPKTRLPTTPPTQPAQINGHASQSEESWIESQPTKPATTQLSGENNKDLAPVENLKDGPNASMVARNEAVLRSQGSSVQEGPRFLLPKGDPINGNQSVTFSTRSISNMSDIMDALNISASTSIKYGTIHGNGNASYVNEDKVLESQINYLVCVRVNNNDVDEAEEMTFTPLEHITPDKFTEVYGDCYIAGFQTGGEFNAIISIDCRDTNKADGIKEAIDLQLAVPPVPGLEIGASQAFDKDHTELFRGIEMTISVNWTGGGELKPPGVPWDLKTVIAAANAYPSMIARSAAKISAILRPYTSLPTFVHWQYIKYAEYNTKLQNARKDKSEKDLRESEVVKELQGIMDARDLWTDKSLILNYAPCQLYTNDLFNAYMQFKTLWKRISHIMSDTKKWRVRTVVQVNKEVEKILGAKTQSKKLQENVRSEPNQQEKKPTLSMITEDTHENGTENSYPSATSSASTTKVKNSPAKSTPSTPHVGSLSRFDTFPLRDTSIKEEWDLDELNKKRDPISLDPVDLNEARLLCREAMTLITEEAYSLVYHPDLAYAEYNKESRKTKMKRPIYMYPEVLKARLPTFIRNDAATARRSRDPIIMKLKQYDDNDLWANLIGDDLNPQWNYKGFVSLEKNEGLGRENPLICLSIHGYVHSRRLTFLDQWYTDSQRAIGGFGFRFENDTNKPKPDGCTQWEGEAQHDDQHLYRKLVLRNPAAAIKNAMEEAKGGEEHHHGKSSIKEFLGNSLHATKPDEREEESSSKKPDLYKAAGENKDIEKIDIFWIPGTGRIAGLVFHDTAGGTELAWKQWEGVSDKPTAMAHEVQYPPNDGTKWRFVGLMGNWSTDIVGHNKVLARVSGIWRKS